MSEIQATHFSGTDINEANKHRVYLDSDYPGYVVVTTTDANDVVELIWHDDKTLTIVINGEDAIWLNADDAKKVVLNTLGGDDKIFVTGETPSGDDYHLRLHGGDGDDMIVGSDGNEQLEGGKGSDSLWGMGGDDTLYGAYDNDSGDRAVDHLFGGDGNDKLHGYRHDQVHGNAGRDHFAEAGVKFGNLEDIGWDDANASNDTYEDDVEKSGSAAPSGATDVDFTSNEDNVRYAQGPRDSEAPPAAEPDESDSVPDADEAEPIAGGAEPEGSESESTTEEPAQAPSGSDSEAPAAASSPDLPSTLPGGGTAAGQVFHFNDQLTGFYADEIAQALDNTQTYAENAQTAADSGDTEGAQQWARMAVQESARADKLLLEAQSRLNAAEQQLNEVLNDPDATDAEKTMAQDQFDEAKLAVETAETQATEAAGLAEDARVAAGLPEGDDGSVPSAEDATTEPGAEGSEPESADATPGAEESEAEAEAEEPGAEAPGAAASEESESSEDPYDQAMDNASEGTNRQESDRQSRGRSGNFLIAMAEAMGLMQAKFLGNAMKHLDTMDSLSAETLPEGDANAERQHREAFLIAQSTFQAEMQMFNIVSQASATALRSTGEGMAAVVRKN